MSDKLLNLYYERKHAREKNEEFFEEHPYPAEIIRSDIDKIKSITIYNTDLDDGNFLIEITWWNWKDRKHYSKLLKHIFKFIEFDIYEKDNSLFFRIFKFRF